MRTGCSLTVCRSLLPGGCLLRGVCVVSQHALRQTTPPPLNRMTDRCKNITLATTSLRPVSMEYDDGISLPPKLFIVQSLSSISLQYRQYNKSVKIQGEKDRSPWLIIECPQLHLWLQVALSVVRVGGKCVVHMKQQRRQRQRQWLMLPLLFNQKGPGRIHWRNRHGSHFSGLTKFQDFSSIFFSIFQFFFIV